MFLYWFVRQYRVELEVERAETNALRPSLGHFIARWIVLLDEQLTRVKRETAPVAFHAALVPFRLSFGNPGLRVDEDCALNRKRKYERLHIAVVA
jgi:hypothetical protein